mmetsp:Transcript_9984/g.29953  ORF Transcript_9984/g.29953 Transcript_9984/m.29953 type:complete len:111 (-) Transcript_9984:113-445(-)
MDAMTIALAAHDRRLWKRVGLSSMICGLILWTGGQQCLSERRAARRASGDVLRTRFDAATEHAWRGAKKAPADCTHMLGDAPCRGEPPSRRCSGDVAAHQMHCEDMREWA